MRAPHFLSKRVHAPQPGHGWPGQGTRKAPRGRLPWPPTAVEWVALILLAVAALTTIAYFTTSAADAWAPNVATEAASIAVTIAVVERIVAHQGRDRPRPRTERAIYWMGLDLRVFSSSIALDYAGTHLHTFKPIPNDVGELCNFWLGAQDEADAGHVPLPGEHYPVLVASAIEFYDDVKRHADPNREILEPELIRAVEDLSWHVGQAMQMHAFSKQTWAGDPVSYERSALSHVVRGAQQFAEAFRNHGDPVWLAVNEGLAEAAASHRDALVRRPLLDYR
jgi:hypothetical protein